MVFFSIIISKMITIFNTVSRFCSLQYIYILTKVTPIMWGVFVCVIICVQNMKAQMANWCPRTTRVFTGIAGCRFYSEVISSAYWCQCTVNNVPVYVSRLLFVIPCMQLVFPGVCNMDHYLTVYTLSGLLFFIFLKWGLFPLRLV